MLCISHFQVPAEAVMHTHGRRRRIENERTVQSTQAENTQVHLVRLYSLDASLNDLFSVLRQTTSNMFPIIFFIGTEIMLTLDVFQFTLDMDIPKEM
jgi:hypothetical protein